MYPYAYPPAPPRLYTSDGLKWSVVAFILYLVSLTVQIALSVFAFSVLGSPGAGFGALLPLLVAGIVLGILILVTLIFYLIGFYNLHKGRNEYGPTHAHDVRRAMYLFIAAVVVAIVGGVVGFILTIAAFTFGPGGFGFDPSALYLSTILSVAFGIVVAALVAGLLVLSVRNLARGDHQRFLYIAAAIGVATPGVTGALTLLQLPRILGLVTDPFLGATSFDATMGLPSAVGGVLGIVAFALYFIVYRAARARIDSGELKSALPPVQPMTWFPGPVAPPYAPTLPQAPPPTPPPPQPPGTP